MIAHLFLKNKELLLFWLFCAFILSLCLFVAEKDNIRQLTTVKGADSNMKKLFDRCIRI